MKRFLLRFLLFALLWALIILGGLLIPRAWLKESLHFALDDKHAALERAAAQPRLILTGGSNVSFGVYSPLLQDALAIPTINTAVHAGYGLRYILEDLSPRLQAGDIVVIIPEYSHFFGQTFWCEQDLIRGLDAHPDGLRHLNAKQWLVVLGDLPAHALQKYRRLFNGLYEDTKTVDPYHREAFNANGDVTIHWTLPAKSTKVRPVSGTFNAAAIDYLQTYTTQLTSKGVKVFISYPCLNRASFVRSSARIAQLEAALTARALPVLGDPERYALADSLYFDSHYHLTETGQKLRTELLLADLQQHLDNTERRE